MRKNPILLTLLLCLCATGLAAAAQLSFGLRAPNVSIGINVPVYPELVRVPGYPVYYAPQLSSNYFFYDGVYWIYEGNDWYASSWYDGPWEWVHPEVVPLYVLRIPVRYYRLPPAYFHGWQRDAPPHWGEHWGNDWAQRRSGWDRWNRNSAPAPAPPPIYQRQYSGNRYPRGEQQQTLRNQHYTYQSRDSYVRQLTPVPAQSVTQQVREQRDQQQRAQPTDQHGHPTPHVIPRFNPPPAEKGAPHAERPQTESWRPEQQHRQREQDSHEGQSHGKKEEGKPPPEQKTNGEHGREKDGDREQDHR